MFSFGGCTNLTKQLMFLSNGRSGPVHILLWHCGSKKVANPLIGLESWNINACTHPKRENNIKMKRVQELWGINHHLWSSSIKLKDYSFWDFKSNGFSSKSKKEKWISMVIDPMQFWVQKPNEW